MKHIKSTLRILVVLFLIVITLGVYTQVRAQGEVVDYVGQKLKQKNVPVSEITLLQKLPISLQVVIKSKSDGEKAAPDDPININLVRREIILANHHGYFVRRFVIVLLSNKGKPMAKVEHSTEIADLVIDTQPSKLTDAETLDRLTDKINLYGMSLSSLDISSFDGLQTVNIYLSVPSIDTANQALPQFMPFLPLLLEDINSQGAQIVNCRLELRDQTGDLLLNYILDLQLRGQNWWMADNLTQDWFPHP